jgi:biopolymer transport protein ExbB
MTKLRLSAPHGAFLLAAALALTPLVGAHAALQEAEPSAEAAASSADPVSASGEAGEAQEPAATEGEAGPGDPAPVDGAPSEAGMEGVDASDGEAGQGDADDASDAADAGEAGDGPDRMAPLYDLIEAGGPIIIILGVLSVISLMVIGVKLVQFALLRVGDHRFVEEVWAELRDGHEDEALSRLERRKGVVARVMESAVRAKSVDGASEAAKSEVERVAKAKLDGLERGLPLLSLIATVSPLLGLLGTVLGMIEAFQQLETAGDRVDPAILSGGIWEALLTTAAGLSVAIPAAAFFTWLQRSVDVCAQHMEDAAVRVFTSELYADKTGGGDEA